VHMAGTLYSKPVAPALSPCCPIGSPLRRVYWLCGVQIPPSSAQVIFLSHEFLPVPDERRSGGDREAALEVWAKEIRELLAKVISKKTVELGASDFDSFSAYYCALRDGRVDVAKSIADSRGK
jgi:hypothetical protein